MLTNSHFLTLSWCYLVLLPEKLMALIQYLHRTA